MKMNLTQLYLKFGHLFYRNFSDDVLFSGNEPSTIVLTVMYTVSFITGLGGNVLALMVLSRRRNRLVGSSATRRLLMNLSVCDMMVVCICMPVNLGHQLHNAWVFGDFLCRTVPFVQAVSVSASVLSLTVISLNRFYSVHNPLHARCFFTDRKIRGMICAVWALSSGLCVPIIFMNKTTTLQLLDGKYITVCVESWPEVRLRQGYNFLLFCTLYGFPVLFNLAICLFTGRKLGTIDDRFKEYNKCNLAQSVSRLKVRKKIAKMVAALVVLFTLSWLPLYVVDIWLDFNMPDASEEGMYDMENEKHQWILQTRPFALWLGLTNSALNPLCYCFVGNLYRSAQRFRKSYRKKLSSVFNMPLPQTSSRSLQTHLSSSRAPSDGRNSETSAWRRYKGFTGSFTKMRSLSSVTVCETVFD